METFDADNPQFWPATNCGRWGAVSPPESSAPPLVDLVVPIHNNLTCTADCLGSLVSFTDVPYRLLIMDDGSDPHAARALSQFSSGRPRAEYHRAELPQGFVKTCNQGIGLGRAPYIVLVNSDVVVTPRWLSRMVRCAQSDARIAVVNPLCNFAANLSIPIAPGASFFRMDKLLEERARHWRGVRPLRYPEIVTAVGFCMLLVRAHVNTLGGFDEIYGMGYCEESDYCMRATMRGYRVAAAPDVYVYHKGRGTFQTRGELYERNRAIFDERWSGEYLKQLKAFNRADPLGPIRHKFAPPLGRKVKTECKSHLLSSARHTRRGELGKAVRAFRAALNAFGLERQERPTAKQIRHWSGGDEGQLRVTYVLPKLSHGGGVLSVVQLVNELTLLGVSARIACVEAPDARVSGWKMYTAPLVFRNAAELVRSLPPTDVLVATMWNTADWVAEIKQRKPEVVTVYFVQDYESWFYPDDEAKQRRVIESYALIGNRIVKSDWLAGLLARHEAPTVKILAGMDLQTFYPRFRESDSPRRVMTMARPKTPRRGFEPVLEAFRLLQARRPEVEFVCFGCENLGKYNPGLRRLLDVGVVTHGEALAQWYCNVDAYIDPSDFQGFGRPGLEAMACGTPTVLTWKGGLSEYARHEENCLLVPPKNPAVWAQALERVLNDGQLAGRFRAQGPLTAQRFCMHREARETLGYFQKLVSGLPAQGNT